jgi:hypothetical protein
VETVETGDTVDSENRQQTCGFGANRMKSKWGRSSVGRTLLCHRHNDVSDLKISNLVQPASVRPVTVSAIFLHFRKLVVRFLLKFLTSSPSEIEVRHVWRKVFRQELIAELFDEES